MADVVGQLTDSELRKRLKLHGQKVGPITKTTRAIWEKKLQKLEASAEPKLEDGDVENEKKKTLSKRRSSVGRRTTTTTTRASSPGRKSVISKNKKVALFSSDEESEVSPNISRRSAQTSPICFPESDELIAKNISRTSDSSRGALQNKTSYSPSYTSIQANTYNTVTRKINSSSKPYQPPPQRSEFSDDDFPEQIQSKLKTRKRFSTPANGGQSSVITSSSRRRSSIDILKTPTASEVESSSIRDEIDASLLQIRNTFFAKKPTPPSQRTTTYISHKAIHNDYNEDDEEEDEELDAEFVPERSHIFSCKNLVISIVCILVALCIVWLYIYEEDNLPAISGDIDEQGLSKTLIGCWYKDLSNLAGQHECRYSSKKWLNRDELNKTAETCLGNEVDLQGIIEKTIKLVKDKYHNYFEFESNRYSSKQISRSLWCRITSAISVIFFRMVFFLCVVACGVGFYFIMKRRWTTDDEETRQMLFFVDKIIDTLRRHHVVCLTNKDIPPYLPIPHVRDMLIPVARRKQMAKIWQKAVDLLNSSDSRIRVEMQRIAGEDYEVWRWIGISTPKIKTKEKNATNKLYLSTEHTKCWQGPAFDEIEKVVRMPIVTPTPCLKIRYMHEGPDEKGKVWITAVADAILEKCIKDGAQILHIYVDDESKEGCVYVKCDGLDSAGKAFRSMYGNWFDGRLVIVKFVTLARYHQRFPDALTSHQALKPSGKSSSSLNWATEDDN